MNFSGQDMDQHMPNDLLHDAIFSVTLAGGASARCSLPEALAAVCRGELEGWDALQPHQYQPWHCFLAQLAAMTHEAQGWSQWPTAPEAWADALLSMTRGVAQAWWLVVEDAASPAFMQPPIPEGSLDAAGYLKNTLYTPDDLDLLITAKNFDVKIQRVGHASPEQWLYALVSLQTLEGFLGAGNYGISRMNGGFGSRPMVSITPSLHPSQWLLRDMNMLVTHPPEAPEGAMCQLLWCEPWGGQKEDAISIARCHPYYIEICRRLRLVRDAQGQLVCHRTTTKGARLDVPKEQVGLTKDPWAPVLENKLLTLSGRGFHYKLVYDLIFSQASPLLAYSAQWDGRAPLIVCTCLVRGQGKTEGFHRRVVPVRNQAIRRGFGNRAAMESAVAPIAAFQFHAISECVQRALRPALYALVNAGEERSGGSGTPDVVSRGTERFEQLVDQGFFEALWQGVELGLDAHRPQWQGQLAGWASQVLTASIALSPVPLVRRYKAVAVATNILQGSLRNIFKEHYESLKAASEQAAAEPLKEQTL